ncbi:MAG: 3'(2'),5'-bisphosphate nucleotidase [Candidatus Methylomirabilales bacterium]
MDSFASAPEVQFALEAVRRASHLTQQVQAELIGASLSKSDRSPVTVADFAVQALVGGLLAAAFPNDPLVAEEASTELRPLERQPILNRVTEFVGRVLPKATPRDVCAWIDRGAASPAARFWTLDPVDGTKGFLRGDQYAVALALVVDGQVKVGVLGCPNLRDGSSRERGGQGFAVVAVRGHGSWSVPLHGPGDFTRLRVSTCSEPAKACLLRSVESDHTDVGLTQAFIRLLGIQAPPVLMDSQAKYALLAAGGGDLLVRLPSPSFPEYRENIWDHAAGWLALEEAGGRITDTAGESLDFAAGRKLARPRGVLASNGHLHAAALEALRCARQEQARSAGKAEG